MNAPHWVQYGGPALVLGAIGALLAFRERFVMGERLKLAPSGASALPSNVGGQPAQIQSALIRLMKGRTYFAVLATTGVIDAAANPDRVKAEAEKQGFRDVFVSKPRPQFFPGTATGDYYVRATFTADDRTIERERSVFLGSVKVLDAWLAAP